MAFTLNIETGNEAFTRQPSAEIARILQGVVEYLTAGSVLNLIDGDSKKLLDINGNTVGRWEYSEEWPHWECPRCHTINADVSAEPGDVTCVDCSLTVASSEVTA